MNRVTVSCWTEGRAACCYSLDTAFAGFNREVFCMDQDCLEGEEVVARNAGTNPAVILVDISRSTHDFADDVFKVPVGAAAVLEAKIGFHLVETVGCVDDGRVAVD